MSKLKLTIIIAISLLISACWNNRPSEKLASETIYKIAENDALDNLEVVNFKRDNGWVDEESTNKYIVQYTYDLRLKKQYAEAILFGANEFQKAYKEENKNTGIDAMQFQAGLMGVNMAVTQWINNQGENFIARRNALIKTCPNCIKYWDSEDNPSEAKDRRVAFIAAWMLYEKYGFNDNVKIGDSVSRRASATFIKTEKGWQPVE